jgi:hypothetical protein
VRYAACDYAAADLERMAEARARAAREGSSAVVLKIGDRYFCGFGRKRGAAEAVLTAWSLAGAKLYQTAEGVTEDWRRDRHKLQASGKNPIAMRVVLAGEVTT